MWITQAGQISIKVNLIYKSLDKIRQLIKFHTNQQVYVTTIGTRGGTYRWLEPKKREQPQYYWWLITKGMVFGVYYIAIELNT